MATGVGVAANRPGHLTLEMRFEIDLRDKHRVVGIRMAELTHRVGDPVVATSEIATLPNVFSFFIFGVSLFKLTVLVLHT
jgi:hypothetical protein